VSVYDRSANGGEGWRLTPATVSNKVLQTFSGGKERLFKSALDHLNLRQVGLQ
jgi:hypothetical protein